MVIFSEIKERVSLSFVLLHYGIEPHPHGKRIVSDCPLCGGSQSLKALERGFKCFSCGKSGNILDLVSLKEVLTTPKGERDIRRAAIMIDEWFGSQERSERAAERGDPNLSPVQAQKPAPEARGEATGAIERGTPLPEPREAPSKRHNDELTLSLKLYPEGTDWNPKTLEHFGAGACRRGMHRGRLAIALHNRQGNLTAYVGRGEDGDKYPPQYIRGLEVYNLHRAQGKMAVLVEDYFDVWRYWEANGKEAVSVAGKEITDTQVEELALAGIKAIDIRIYDCPQIIEKLVFDFYIRLSRL